MLDKNKQANIYRIVGSDAGAFKDEKTGRWVGFRCFRELSVILWPWPMHRWQGPPTRAIIRALRNPQY